MIISSIKISLLSLLLFFSAKHMQACSMYKITVGNKTMVGCNEDAWRLTPHVWFETSTPTCRFGAAFTGSRFDGENGYAPQSGMNEAGLCYSRLATYTPLKPMDFKKSGTAITNPTMYLKGILHNCQTVDEVKAWISQYDHSYFTEDVFIYIDQSGQYLIVEPYSLTIGDRASYVLSNFCPSVTNDKAACRLDRYRNGISFLKRGADTTLAFCAALSDTMHVCRPKIGDGTLLTSIWEPSTGDFHLYFYHAYQEVVNFNLKTELAKGNHQLAVDTLFQPNKEFKELATYRIPQNTASIRLGLMGVGVWFFISALFFLVRVFQNKTAFVKVQICLVVLGLWLFFDMLVLCTHQTIFYFAAPYVDGQNIFVSLTSYLPFVLSIAMGPLLVFNWRVYKNKVWSRFSTGVLILNNLLSIGLIFGFVYWGLFSFWL
jgi:hypothetical protein